MAWANGVRTLVAIAALTGCFQDTPTGGGEGTTGGDCPIGSRGCACTGGGGCDVGLECLAEAGVCIDVDCTPGEGMCSCNAGACAEGFECIDDYCRPIGSTSSMTTPLTDASSTLPEDTFGTTDFTSGTMTSFSEVGPTATFGTFGSETFATTSDSCMDCLTAARDTNCVAEYGPCDAACDELLECFGTLEIDCCGALMPPAAWNDFADCAADCTFACGVASLVCMGGLTSSSS
jgi:hypothetical protein